MTTKTQSNSMIIEGVKVQLAPEYTGESVWIGGEIAVHQLRAAWLSMDKYDPPMNPRIIGKPGVGKTTLAISVAKELGVPVYLMQGTSDTRPEDLLITPVIAENQQIIYVASPLVTAMLKGGVCILDEGNRMAEKSWASLTALLDHRRYIDSIIAGVRINAHENFRFATTMNDDSSVFDLPEYIQSRLNPQILLDFAEADEERQIIKNSVPYTEQGLLDLLVGFLSVMHMENEPYSVRDGIQIAKYASRLKNLNPKLSAGEALTSAIESVLGNSAASKFSFIVTKGGKDPRSLRPV